MKIIIDNRSKLPIHEAMDFANKIIQDAAKDRKYCACTTWEVFNIGVYAIQNKKSVRIVVFNLLK